MFAACAFPVHTWSILILMWELPAWIIRLDLWELLGVIAYTQAFALVESLIILLGMLLLTALLPRKWFRNGALDRNKVVALNTVVVFSVTVWVITAQVNYEVVRTLSMRSLLPWLIACLASIALIYILVYRYKKLETLIVSFVDRLLTLATVYLFMDILSILVIVVRNIGGSAWPS